MPSGVDSYGHKKSENKGKAHPKKVGGHVSMVEGNASFPKEYTDFKVGPKQSTPKNARGGDGTATLRGTKVVHKQKREQGPGGSMRSVLPSDVRKHKGTSAPRKVK
jgi:hypothetical protein